MPSSPHNTARRAYLLTDEEVAKLSAREARSRLASPTLGGLLLLTAGGAASFGAVSVLSGWAWSALLCGLALGVFATLVLLVARTEALSPLELVDSFVSRVAEARSRRRQEDPPSSDSGSLEG